MVISEPCVTISLVECRTVAYSMPECAPNHTTGFPKVSEEEPFGQSLVPASSLLWGRRSDHTGFQAGYNQTLQKRAGERDLSRWF